MICLTGSATYRDCDTFEIAILVRSVVDRSPTHDEKSFMRESARNTYRPAVPPARCQEIADWPQSRPMLSAEAWLQHDRQVLKFSAYSQAYVHSIVN